MNDDTPRNNLSYESALHGIQTGVAYEQQIVVDPMQASYNKHLRVGVDSCMVSDAALVRLLIKKGIITAEEHAEELRLEANRELDRYEDRVRARFGSDTINLR